MVSRVAGEGREGRGRRPAQRPSGAAWRVQGQGYSQCFLVSRNTQVASLCRSTAACRGWVPRGAEPRSEDLSVSGGRNLAYVQRRLLRTALQLADADQQGQREVAEAGLGLPNPRCDAEIDSAAGGWNPVLHSARSCVGRGRANGSKDMGVSTPVGGRPHWTSRRRLLQGPHLLRNSRCAPDLPGRAEWK